MQRDLHFNATLALCVRAKYSKEEALLIAWASWMTDEWSGTQVKWPWQVWWNNPGPSFHFVVGESGVVEANSPRVRELVKAARDPHKYLLSDEDRCIQLGIAIHAFMDSYSHAGFVGRLDAINEMGLQTSWLRRLIPHYGHTQLLRHPDRAEVTWTDTRTMKIRYNGEIFRDALYAVYDFVCQHETHTDPPYDITSVVFWETYDSRKTQWAKLAGMPDIRFSKIRNEMWAKHGKEFKAAAVRQRKYLQRN